MLTLHVFDRIVNGSEHVIEVRVESPEGPDARRLLEALETEKAERYPHWDSDVALRVTPDEMLPPQGAFLIAYHEGRAVGCGGVRRLEPEVAELKRLYVAPEARKLGAGLALMEQMEDTARKLGCTVARLDTDPALQEAQRLFERLGYRQREPYNENPNAGAWWEKDL